MDVLIVYGTTEGQTRKIAEWTATYIREREHHAELRDSAAPMSDLILETFHAFIIAASVHQQYHQETVTDFVIAHHKLLNAKPSAFISVSLSAVLEGEMAEAQRYVDHFVSLTGWYPRMTLLLGGALRFTEYDYFQEQIVKFIVMKAPEQHATKAIASSRTGMLSHASLTRFSMRPRSRGREKPCTASKRLASRWRRGARVFAKFLHNIFPKKDHGHWRRRNVDEHFTACHPKGSNFCCRRHSDYLDDASGLGSEDVEGVSRLPKLS